MLKKPTRLHWENAFVSPPAPAAGVHRFRFPQGFEAGCEAARPVASFEPQEEVSYHLKGMSRPALVTHWTPCRPALPVPLGTSS